MEGEFVSAVQVSSDPSGFVTFRWMSPCGLLNSTAVTTPVTETERLVSKNTAKEWCAEAEPEPASPAITSAAAAARCHMDALPPRTYEWPSYRHVAIEARSGRRTCA